MQQITNFFMVSRLDPTSSAEKIGDRLLTCFQTSLGGRYVRILPNQSVYVQHLSPPVLEQRWVQIIYKPLFASLFIPLTLSGVCFKLFSLRDQNYRNFFKQVVPLNSTCHPKQNEIFKYIHYTSNYISPSRGFFEDTTYFTPLDLYECACSTTHAFDRLKSPRRDNLENAIVQRLVENESDKDQQIKLMSLGSGGLMSDFLMIAKLILKGEFKNFLLTCIEPNGIDSKLIQNIQQFFADYPDVTLTLQSYKSINDVPLTESGYHACLAIDYDVLATWNFDGVVDLMTAYRSLKDTGFVGLGSGDNDILFGPNRESLKLDKNFQLIHGIADDFVEQFLNTEQLSLAFPTLNFAGATHLLMLSLAFANEKKNKPLSQISVTFLTRIEGIDDRMPDYQSMMESLFPNIKIHVGYQNDQTTKFDLLFAGTEDMEYKFSDYLTHLEDQSLIYTFGREEEIYRQRHGLEDSKVKLR